MARWPGIFLLVIRPYEQGDRDRSSVSASARCRVNGCLRAMIILLLVSVGSLAIAADEPIIEPELVRRDVRIPQFDDENFELTAFAGILSIEDFGSHAVYGLRVAYHVTPGLFMEGTYGRSEAGDTSYELLSGGVRLLTSDERQLSYYNLSFAYNLLPGETFIGAHAYTSDFYLIAGIGSTDFAGNQRFTTNLGAGYRLLVNDWLAVHIDMRDHLFDSDLFGDTKTTHNIEMSAGLSVFF